MGGMFWKKAEQPGFLRYALRADLDEETAYTICVMISSVGWAVKDEWDWNWLEKRRGSYRSLISRSLAVPAWRVLAEKDWFSLQTVNDETKRITTIAPLESMTNLSSLVLQNNEIVDLQPLAKMSKLKYLNIYGNKVADLSPLVQLQSLEELSLAENPIETLDILEQLPKLRQLTLSTNQIPRFARCRFLASIQVLEIVGDAPVENLTNFPEMPSLKVLEMRGLKDLAGIERLGSLNTLELIYGNFSRLDGAEKLKGLTHFEAWSSQPLSLQPLSTMYALRSVKILAPGVADLSALDRLPVLHELKMCDETKYNPLEFETLNKLLTPWAEEFRATEKKAEPSLRIEIVSQETFDFYDSKAPFGIKPGECEDGMFHSERQWLMNELRGTLEVNFKEDLDGDFFLPGTTGFRRSERIVLYSLHAAASVREIITAVQGVLCETQNEWIIYFQGLMSEGPDFEKLPDDARDFIVWIYPDRIMATEENAAVIRELMG